MSLVKPPSLPGQQRSIAVGQPRKVSRWELIFRIGIVGLLLFSMGMAWWTLTQELAPLQQQSQALGAAVSHLSDQVEALQRKWPPADVEQVRNRYKELRTQLFADEVSMRAWMDRLSELSGLLSLEVQVVLGKSRAQVTNDVKIAVIPASVSVEVRPTPGAPESPYQRILRFGQQLRTEGKRADLAELSVVGGTNSITRALLVFNLWAGDETAENKTASAR